MDEINVNAVGDGNRPGVGPTRPFPYPVDPVSGNFRIT